MKFRCRCLSDKECSFVNFSNLAKSEEEGYGIKLEWDDLTESLLFDAIQKLLHEPR